MTLRSQRAGLSASAGPSMEEFLQAVLQATPERKAAAFQILRGEVASVSEVRTLPPPEPYLSLRGLADTLGVSVCTLWRWKVPWHNLGGRKKYKRSEIETYLKSEAFARRSACLRAERKAPSERGSNPKKGETA